MHRSGDIRYYLVVQCCSCSPGAASIDCSAATFAFNNRFKTYGTSTLLSYENTAVSMAQLALPAAPTLGHHSPGNTAQTLPPCASASSDGKRSPVELTRRFPQL